MMLFFWLRTTKTVKRRMNSCSDLVLFESLALATQSSVDTESAAIAVLRQKKHLLCRNEAVHASPMRMYTRVLDTADCNTCSCLLISSCMRALASVSTSDCSSPRSCSSLSASSLRISALTRADRTSSKACNRKVGQQTDRSHNFLSPAKSVSEAILHTTRSFTIFFSPCSSLGLVCLSFLSLSSEKYIRLLCKRLSSVDQGVQ